MRADVDVLRDSRTSTISPSQRSPLACMPTARIPWSCWASAVLVYGLTVPRTTLDARFSPFIYSNCHTPSPATHTSIRSTSATRRMRRTRARIAGGTRRWPGAVRVPRYGRRRRWSSPQGAAEHPRIRTAHHQGVSFSVVVASHRYLKKGPMDGPVREPATGFTAFGIVIVVAVLLAGATLPARRPAQWPRRWC